MGLDGVEMVMELEDEFGIGIPDDEAERMQTVGQTVEFIARELAARRPAGPGVCPSARAFYRLRTTLMRGYQTPRSVVRPNATVGELVPDDTRRFDWNERVAEACDLRPEPFRWSKLLHPRIPPPEMTVRELIATRSTGRAAGDDRFAGPNGEVAMALIYEKVVDVVSEQCGVRRSEIHWDTRYVEDLLFG